MNNFKVLVNGIIKENPTFVLLLGMCPTLGTTSSAINGMQRCRGLLLHGRLFVLAHLRQLIIGLHVSLSLIRIS